MHFQLLKGKKRNAILILKELKIYKGDKLDVNAREH